MILRSLTMAASLAGGLAASQFPAFSQQYAQRLGGAVDELSQVVADFDASARAAGLTREEALRDLAGSTFRDRRQQDMRRTFRRHARLSAVRAELAEASALDRLTLVPKAADRDIADAAWAEFRPSVPLTWDGLLFAAAGFFGLLAMLRLTGAAIGMSRGAARRTRGRRVQ